MENNFFMVIKLKAHTKKSSRYLADALFSNCLIRTKKNPKFIAKAANLSKNIKIFFFYHQLICAKHSGCYWDGAKNFNFEKTKRSFSHCLTEYEHMEYILIVQQYNGLHNAVQLSNLVINMSACFTGHSGRSSLPRI